MRLLNTQTLRLETFSTSNVPDYATLSHTWNDDEVSFQDIENNRGRKRKAWSKILGMTREAKKHDYKYVWIDTCCIDKTSSAELSEAINSMFRWYRKSSVCFTYLEDVLEYKGPWITEIESDSDFVTTPPPSPLSLETQIPHARWFERGWTLQELIAPNTMYFYDSAWNKIGSKNELGSILSNITGIDLDVLCDPRALYHKSVARRMSWASKRETTRVEDMAYCLIGIFNISMSLLYGEGERAFVRLQEEIMRSHYDHSLFAWNFGFTKGFYGTRLDLNADEPPLGVGFLAPHPVAFSDSADIAPRSMKTEPYALTNRGVQIYLHILEDNDGVGRSHFAILQCGYINNFGIAIAIPITQISESKTTESEYEYCRTAGQDIVQVKYSSAATSRKQRVYLVAAGQVSFSVMSQPVHRCWLREYGRGIGVKFHKAVYCQYPANADGEASHCWNYTNHSMSWSKDWHGSRAALLFSEFSGLVFVVFLSFIRLPNDEREIGMEVRIMTVPADSDAKGGSLLQHFSTRRLLREHIPNETELRLCEGQAEFHSHGKVFIARINKEVIFDEDTFVLDVSVSGVKRKRSESTSDRS